VCAVYFVPSARRSAAERGRDGDARSPPGSGSTAGARGASWRPGASRTRSKRRAASATHGADQHVHRATRSSGRPAATSDGNTTFWIRFAFSDERVRHPRSCSRERVPAMIPAACRQRDLVSALLVAPARS
jgi:hypothetical protein